MDFAVMSSAACGQAPVIAQMQVVGIGWTTATDQTRLLGNRFDVLPVTI